MEIIYLIQDVETWKHLDWYCWTVYFESDIINVRNWIYKTYEDALKDMTTYQAELDWKYLQIVKIYKI